MSAYDLSVIARNSLADPGDRDPGEADGVRTSSTRPGQQRFLTNHNDGFLTTYGGATGLKTGFTKRANHTLVTSATPRWPHDDHGRARHLGRHRLAGYLLDQGFSHAGRRTREPARSCRRCVPITADMRRQAFEGLPAALGRPALDGSASVPISATRPARKAADRSADRRESAATERPKASEPSSSNESS